MGNKKVKVTSNKKELCPICKSDEFAVAKDAHSTRYCQKCRHTWAPMTNDQLLVLTLKDKIEEHKALGKLIVNMVDSVVDGLNDKSTMGEFLITLKEVRSKAMGIR